MKIFRLWGREYINLEQIECFHCEDSTKSVSIKINDKSWRLSGQDAIRFLKEVNKELADEWTK